MGNGTDFPRHWQALFHYLLHFISCTNRRTELANVLLNLEDGLIQHLQVQILVQHVRYDIVSNLKENLQTCRTVLKHLKKRVFFFEDPAHRSPNRWELQHDDIFWVRFTWRYSCNAFLRYFTHWVCKQAKMEVFDGSRTRFLTFFDIVCIVHHISMC